MPSGAKKRKAAKKHKQALTSTHHSPTNSLQGNDEKESDGGEVSSPTNSQSEEVHNHHQLGKEQEEQRDSLSVESAAIATASDNKLMEGSRSVHGGDGVVEVVRDLKSPNDEEVVVVETVTEGSSGSRTISIEFVEPVKLSNGDSESSSSSSSSGSSDEESGSVEKKEEYQIPVQEQLKELDEVKGGNCTLVMETEIVVDPIEEVSCDPVEQVVTLSEEVTQVVEVLPAEKIGDSSVIDSWLKESEEKTLPASDVQGFDISNGVEHHTEYGTAESSVNQQQVALAPTVQRTSWKSCCGLFDVLRGSNR